MFLELIKADGPAGIHILNSLPDAFEHAGFFGDLAKFLVRGSVLDDQLGLAVDGQDDGLAGFFQLVNKFGCVLFEIGQRMNLPVRIGFQGHALWDWVNVFKISDCESDVCNAIGKRMSEGECTSPGCVAADIEKITYVWNSA